MKPRSNVRRFFRNNGLLCFLLAFFLVTYVGGQIFSGLKVWNEERAGWGQPPISLGDYLGSAHFAEATMENWESEFLQMFIYVYITAFLFQKGSSESNDPDQPEAKRRVTAQSPWPVRRGGWWLKIYEHSLSIALGALFIGSFAAHALSSNRLENLKQAHLGQTITTVWQHLGGSQFWFESFQNWQSEFLSIAGMVFFTIYLRERNSPESKAVEAPHNETGG